MRLSILLMALLLLQGCAPKAPPALSAWEGDPISVQFSARVLPQAADLPLQGGLRMESSEGTVGIIMQHGRTLGQCTLQNQPEDGKLRLHCTVAEGLGTREKYVLERAALAAYRTLHWLGTQGSPGTEGEGWRVYPTQRRDLQPLAYEDSLGKVIMTFWEVRP